MTEEEALISAHLLDGRGGGRGLSWEEVAAWTPDDGVLWVHLDRSDPHTRKWLEGDCGLPKWVADALLAEETRPRVTEVGEAFLLILRGVNLNPGSDPEDMVSIRLWIERDRVISTRRRKVMAIADLRDALNGGKGAKNSGDLLVGLSARLVDRMSPVVDGLDDAVDELEEEVIARESHAIRSKLARLRRETIAMRRYIGPQRDVMSRLQSSQVSWLDQSHRVQLREIYDRVTRYVEDLDAARERAAVTQDELAGRLAEQMNRTMYTLSVVATIFLPLGLITGLLGINVGGIPGTDYPLAFGLVTAGLVTLAVVEVFYFRRRRIL